MRIQLASDLHLEFLDHDYPGERVISPVPDADVLVLAGDISTGSSAIALFKDWPVPVIYVAGNHEFYSRRLEDIYSELRTKAAGTSIHFLEQDTVELDGVRFLGCTLWTDYELDGPQNKLRNMDAARRRLNDHRLISTREGRPFSPERALIAHQLSREWLRTELNLPYEGTTVVVTHHLPHPKCVDKQYAGEALNAAFASDLSELVAQADFWFHGHTHSKVHFSHERCEVNANPLGYPRNRSSVLAIRDVRFENGNFDYAKVIDTLAPKNQTASN